MQLNWYNIEQQHFTSDIKQVSLNNLRTFIETNSIKDVRNRLIFLTLQTIETASLCKTAVDTICIFMAQELHDMETWENVTTISRGEHKNSTLSKWRVSNYGRAHNWGYMYSMHGARRKAKAAMCLGTSDSCSIFLLLTLGKAKRCILETGENV